MNPVQIIATLRKFGNYIAGLFPFLAAMADWLARQVFKLVDNPLVAPWWKKCKQSAFLQSVWMIIERFYWRTYSKDRLDLSESPPRMLSVLRPIFQLCAVLCLLIPLTQYRVLLVPIETFAGFVSNAPSWSVVLWLLALPCAWSALLAGTAASNRIAFVLSALGALYFMSTCVIVLPRSFFNSLLGACVLIALCFCERRLRNKGKIDQVLGLVNCLVVGVAAGIQINILTPIKPQLAALFPQLSGPVIGIGGGAIIGAVLGILCFVWSRLPENPARPYYLRGGSVDMGKVVWSMIPFLVIFLLAGISRGGLGQSGGLLISSLNLSNGYLWPVWYFIGIGILHKLMGSSKIVAASLEGMLPPRILTPLLLVLLVALTLVCISEKVCVFLIPLAGKIPDQFFLFFASIFNATKQQIWFVPLNAMAAHWLTWVLLFDLAVVSIAIVQRRLSSQAVLRLFFMTCLATLLIWEYLFQLSSFARTPSHSVILLFLFAVWLLWLMHTVGWSLSSRSSPLWPSEGRFATYGGIVALAMLEIHARTASQDFKLMNELFLSMFRGIIDVGLPYYLLVWTSKRITQLPVRIATMLGIFSLGAIASFLFNVLDKLAAGNWMPGQLSLLVATQLEQLKNTGSPNMDLHLPATLFLVKALIYVVFLVIIYWAVRKKMGVNRESSQTVLFLQMTFASGMVAFSKTLVELPLPMEIRALIAPLVQETTFNSNVFQSYLAYWIPALLLGVAQLGKRCFNPRIFWATTLVASVIYFGISYSAQEHEVFLRASGLIYRLMAILAGVLVVLIAYVVQQIVAAEEEDKPQPMALVAQTGTPEPGAESESASEEDEEDEEEDEPKPSLPKGKAQVSLLSFKAFVGLVLAAELAYCLSPLEGIDRSFRPWEAPVFSHMVIMSSNWEPLRPLAGETTPPDVTRFARKNKNGTLSVMQMRSVAANPQGNQALLKSLIAEGKLAEKIENMPHFAVLSVQSWNKYYPGAVACQFSFDDKDQPYVGLAVLATKGESTEIYQVNTSPSELEREKWELAFTLQKLALHQ